MNERERIAFESLLHDGPHPSEREVWWELPRADRVWILSFRDGVRLETSRDERRGLFCTKVFDDERQWQGELHLEVFDKIGADAALAEALWVCRKEVPEFLHAQDADLRAIAWERLYARKTKAQAETAGAIR
jgi:hypothetical protein